MPNQYISHSRIKLFNGCKLQYKFHYIDKLPEIPGSPLIKGKAIHALIELYEKHCIEKRKNTNMGYVNDLKKQFRSDQKTILGYTDKDLIQTELNEEDILDVFDMLDMFVGDFMLNFNHNKNIEIERKFAVDKNFKFVDYDDKSAIFKGVMDQIFTRSGGSEVVVTDWKSNRFMETNEILENNLQLKLYAFIGELLYPEATKFTMRYYYIRYRSYLETSISHMDLIDMERIIVQNHRRINEAKSYGYSLGSQCGYCNYKDRCSGMKTAVKYALVDKPIKKELTAQKKAEHLQLFEMKVAMLKKELKEYCKDGKEIQVGDQILAKHPNQRKSVDARGVSLIANKGCDTNDPVLRYATLSNDSLGKMTKNLDPELYKKAEEEGLITTKYGTSFGFAKMKTK